MRVKIQGERGDSDPRKADIGVAGAPIWPSVWGIKALACHGGQAAMPGVLTYPNPALLPEV